MRRRLHRLGALVCLCLLALGACQSPTVPEPTPTPDPVVAQGRELFSRHCASCHAVEPDTVIVGPSLAGMAGQAGERIPGFEARAYLLQSIVQPGAYVVEGFDDSMPSNFGKRLTGEEIDALVAYLLTFDRSAEGEGG